MPPPAPPPTTTIQRPSIVKCDTDSKRNQNIYDSWASNFEHDIRAWKYDMPEKVADILLAHKFYLGADQKKRANAAKDPKLQPKLLIFDAGAGDGLSGVALRQAGFDTKSTHIIGGDISTNMLQVAKNRGCYDETKIVDLNDTPLPFATDTFDAVTCVGTLTYVNPNSGVLDEFARITRPGGLICFTLRTDQVDRWKLAEEQLDSEGKWYEEDDPVGPLPYLPGNPQYGEEVQVFVSLYRVLDPE